MSDEPRCLLFLAECIVDSHRTVFLQARSRGEALQIYMDTYKEQPKYLWPVPQPGFKPQIIEFGQSDSVPDLSDMEDFGDELYATTIAVAVNAGTWEHSTHE